MTTYATPKVGDTLVVVAKNERMRFGVHVGFHGVQASVTKVTPTGRLDVMFQERDGRRSQTVRTLPWNGRAAARDDGVRRNSFWSVFHPLTEEAQDALGTGDTLHELDVVYRNGLKEKARLAFLAPDCTFEPRLRRDEIEAILALGDQGNPVLKNAFETLRFDIDVERR